ncbi:MAG: LTA synthase family protein [Chitinophagaceae bacterium]|nr:LTA synthase family protein [Chitinophagaceae bacterium]
MKETILKKLQQKPFFLVLLPVFFILHGYNEFFGFFTLKFTALHLTAVLLFTAILYLTAYVYFRSLKKTALFSFWFLLLLLTFGSVHDLLKKIAPGFFSSYTFLLPLILLVVFVLIVRIKKSPSLFLRTFTFLNLVMISFLLYEFADGIQRFIQVQKGSNVIDNRFTAFKNYKPLTPVAEADKPDIYFLVFDGMPSTSAMKQQWNYDNSSLDSFLLKEKFYVAVDAKSNYNITMLSVSSCMNMEYLLHDQIYTGSELKMIQKASPSLLNNSLIKILKKEDYKIYQYQSLSTNNPQWKGELFFSYIMSTTYLYKTLPGRIYKDLGWHFNRFQRIKKIKSAITYKDQEAHKNNLQYTIDLIKNSCKDIGSAKFIYGHFMIPHEPFVFDSAGKVIPPILTENNEEQNVRQFIDQVKYTNKIIQQLVAYIKRNNKKNTVIIIEGDHGYRNIYGKQEYLIFDNLQTIYYPDGNYSAYKPTHSPINTFRFVLNKYFHTQFLPLTDTSYYIPYNMLPTDTTSSPKSN